MKKKIKNIFLVVIGFVLIITSIFSSYLLSFIKTEDNVNLENKKSLLKETAELALDKEASTLELSSGNNNWFNYYAVEYSSDCYIKATVNYLAGVKPKSEDFFLEPSEEKTAFYSFVDDVLDGNRGSKINSITFEALTETKKSIKIYGVYIFNREIPEQEIFIENDTHKLGIDLLWGGALSYLEDLDSNVQAVSVDGQIKVDSDASKRYNAESINNNINLINRNDTGRLVQQSYYGTLDYDHGVYMDNDWRYNPVQGGNVHNDASKIVDLRVTDTEIYIKCRPLDWAKEKEYITPSYMEATYSLEKGGVHAKCRFVDFSGYPEAECTQEIPAFYCIEPLNNFVYYKGDKPWKNEPLTNEPDLIFWPDAGYPNFYSKENWAAFTGEFEDSFGIGVYVDNEEAFLAGVFNRETTSNEDPSRDSATSYIAIVKNRTFKSFDPYQYEYYLATGNTTEIRSTFEAIDNK